jgi:cytochrome c biogenesis protein CcmG/thiol:disulfide interchange protein DsbE
MSAIARSCWLAAAALAIGGPAFAAKPRVGDPAPHYVVHTFDKQEIDSATLKGQVVIINRWAMWCGPCKRELPELDTYYRAHGKDGLRVFAVTVDDTVPDYKLTPLSSLLAFPLAHSVHGGFPEMEGVPTNYVIDRNGIVRYAAAAAFDAATLDKVIGPLLAEPASLAPATVATR